MDRAKLMRGFSSSAPTSTVAVKSEAIQEGTGTGTGNGERVK